MHEQGPTSRVVMIDDQVSFVDAFGLALSITPDFELVGRAPDAPAGKDLCRGLSPDLVVCDYRLPDGRTGTEVASELRADGFGSPIVILTGFLAPQVKREAEALPDVLAVSKDSPITDIISSMRSALDGNFAASEAAIDDETLSPGELEVLEMLNQGNSAAEIADMLHLSLHTIRARIKGMHRKLNVTSQVEAISKATRLGLLVPPG